MGGAIEMSGIDRKVGRIVGGVQSAERIKILKTCSVVIFTPDVIHAFLLGKLGDVKLKQAIKNFLSQVKIIIIDEAHTYSGVFGSNSAYLYRRLETTQFRHFVGKFHNILQLQQR
jgi:DEAD/DEAH box helicase domain-containing protein